MPNDKKARAASRSRRVKLIVAYDGTAFSGWQSQANGDTIQDRIEAAFAQVIGRKIRVHGAGRTDAGVHAMGQCAHADVATHLPPEILQAALNASLPPAIRILRCRFVAPTFHARFDARGKIYRYRIATTAVLLPLEIGRAWHVTAPLDDARLRACAHSFLGRHDFAHFSANRGKGPTSTIRTIRKVRIRRTTALTEIEVEGDGFLYKMVRMMVGAIVRCGRGRLRLRDVEERLCGQATEHVRLVAPAAGLTLVRVQY